MCLGQGCIAGKRQAGIQTAFEPLPSASLCSLAFSRVVTPAARDPPSPAPLAAPSPSSSPSSSAASGSVRVGSLGACSLLVQLLPFSSSSVSSLPLCSSGPQTVNTYMAWDPRVQGVDGEWASREERAGPTPTAMGVCDSLLPLPPAVVGLDIQDEMGRHEVGHIDNSMKIPLNNGAGCRFEGQFSINKVWRPCMGPFDPFPVPSVPFLPESRW